MSIFWQVVLKRFIRVFVLGFIGNASVIAPGVLNNWRDLSGWLTAITIAGVAGGVTALLAAIDKAVRFQ